MLNNKSITFYIKRLKANNIYCSNSEIRTMVSELTPAEICLYTTLRDMALGNCSAEELKTAELASKLGVRPNTLSKLKVALKIKGYAVIAFSRDADNDLLAQVYLGKDQVTLYNLGLKVEITNAAAYTKLLKMFPIDNPALTKEQREDMVQVANTYYNETLK